MYSHSPLPQSPQSPQFARRSATQELPPYSPQYVHQLSPQYASPYSPYYSSQGSPQFVPYSPQPFGYADTDTVTNAAAASNSSKAHRKPSPAPTWAFVIFRIITIALSVPLIYFAARLLHNWPSVYRKTAIGIAAAFLAIVSDFGVIKLFYDRSKYLSLVLIPEAAVVILAIVSIVEFIRAGLTDAAGGDTVQDNSATVRLLGLAFSFIVCGVRIFSMIINSIIACMMRSQSPARPRSRTVFIVQPTEDLY